ncbi:DUF5994 family protein [Nocardia sp. NBC_01730]|uniref:DUF5994 family protein n=1 Tax=Nocardia sp. NBC_01730 TaxID=2975998 RepID=UPI002E0FB6C4|nr:DUF5994 family protein [Nocardia sp. NBC_01730]
MRFRSSQNNRIVVASAPLRPQSARHRVPPEYTPRLRLKAKTERGGYIDGAWWPRSGDLTAELPDLLAVLAVRLGPIWRVVYDPAGWSSAPRQLTVGDRAIRLDAYPFQLWNTMYVFGSDSDLIVLRVIPSATEDEPAHSALMAAVGREPATSG